MEDKMDNFGFAQPGHDMEKLRKQEMIKDITYSVEAFEQQVHGEIDADDPKAVAQFAQKFQISVNELLFAMLLYGNSVAAIKAYLSV